MARMAAPKQTLYDILGWSRDATTIDIGLAYQKAIASAERAVPPDPTPPALIQQAHEILSNARRAAYDASLVTAAEKDAARVHAAAPDLGLAAEEEEVAPRFGSQRRFGVGVEERIALGVREATSSGPPRRLLRSLRMALMPVLLAPCLASAGRPLTTEDAAALEHGRCQLESWIDRSRDSRTGWLVPACNFGGGIEWQAGAARTREAGAGRFSEAYVQAKRTFFEVEEDRSNIGLGFVAGVARSPLNERHRGWSNPYVTVPLTFATSTALFHVNAGWSRDKKARRDATTWGIAAELPSGRWTAVAEAFGENSSRPSLRVGARWSALPDILDLDLTWVTTPGQGAAGRYISLGFTLVTPQLRR